MLSRLTLWYASKFNQVSTAQLNLEIIHDERPLLLCLGRRGLSSCMLSRSYRLSMRAGGEPLINMRPGVLERAASRHHANMTSLDLQHALILAANLRHDALRLTGRRDMIGQRDHIEQVRAD